MIKYNSISVGVALCNSSAFYGWSPNKEYVFRYESQVITGIPSIQQQFAGLKLSSDVRVQSFGDYSLRIKFENPKFIVVNQELKIKDGRPQVPLPTQVKPKKCSYMHCTYSTVQNM